MVAGLTDAENLHGHSTASIARLIRRVVGYGDTASGVRHGHRDLWGRHVGRAVELSFAIFYGRVTLLVAASGVAAVTRDWVFPMTRPRVRRVRFYGWGQLVLAFGLCWQVVFRLVISDPGIRQWVTLPGSGLLLAGVIVMGVSQRADGDRQSGGTP
ncbi:hypothetical protein ACFYYI_17060 [Streptomyces sp. NPDC002387]|uniref:hypothetical protein n=1 Tax=unclassified Streptomyces TaxID=2593676 RepID=UPI0036BFBE2D